MLDIRNLVITSSYCGNGLGRHNSHQIRYLDHTPAIASECPKNQKMSQSWKAGNYDSMKLVGSHVFHALGLFQMGSFDR